MNVLHRAIRPVIREVRVMYYEWAVAEINPMHPDAHLVARRLAALRRERYADPKCIYRKIWRLL